MKYLFLITTFIEFTLGSAWAQMPMVPVYKKSAVESGQLSTQSMEKTGRYVIKKDSSKRKPASEALSLTLEPKLLPQKNEHTKAAAPAIESMVQPIQQATSLEAMSAVERTPKEGEQPELDAESGLSQLKNTVLGGDSGGVEEYKSYLHPQDNRLNIMEAYLAPMFIANNSDSQSWYRTYTSASPGVLMGARIWFTPFFGVETNYQSTLGADINTSPNTNTRTMMSNEWFTFGLRYRRFFGYTLRAPSINYGVTYRDQYLKVPVDETGRVRTKTTGISFSAEANFPETSRKSWILGAELSPLQRHQESSNANSYRSGSDAATYGVGFTGGQEYKFYRTQRIYWKLKYYMEKNIFSGTSTAPDPVSAGYINGVTVTNTFTTFEIGYIWGN